MLRIVRRLEQLAGLGDVYDHSTQLLVTRDCMIDIA